jgi:hypothetical protein
MGQGLHGGATTTEAVRRAIQRNEESLRTLAKRHGVNQKTIAKWRRRSSTADLPTGPKEPRSTSPTSEEEAVVVALCPAGMAYGSADTRCCRWMTASALQAFTSPLTKSAGADSG